MEISYAQADVACIRKENDVYVDKSPVITRLENLVEKHLTIRISKRMNHVAGDRSPS